VEDSELQALTTDESQQRFARLTLVALLLTCVVFGLWLAYSIETNSPADFSVYYMAGALARHGRSYYEITRLAWNQWATTLGVNHYTWPYRYPPYAAALLRLMTPLGLQGAMIVWVVANAVSMIAGAWLVGATLGRTWRLPLALATLAVFGPAYHTLYDGQINGLVFLALAVGFWGLARGRDVPAGAGVAVAAVLKLTPVALIVYFAWRRRWRALFAALATVVLITLVSLPLTGINAFVQYSDRAYALTDPQHVNPSGANQTATGALARLLLPTAVKTTTARAPHAIRLLANLFTVALLAATALLLWPRRSPPADQGSPRAVTPACAGAGSSSGANADSGANAGAGSNVTRGTRGPASLEELLGYGMIIAASLIIGPFTWYHQFVWLLLPLLMIADRWFVNRRRVPLLLLALLVLGVDANELLWTKVHHTMITSGLYRALSVPFVAALLTWAIMALMIIAFRRSRRADRFHTEPADGIT
jgi:hypothetical protein